MDKIVATTALAKMAPEEISEHLYSKNLLGEHTLVCLLIIYMHIYTLDINVTPLQKILATGLLLQTQISTNKNLVIQGITETNQKSYAANKS